METAHTITDLRKLVSAARGRGEVVGLVPTMGALHAGHLSLVDAARGECGFVVVSIFVNPTQFAPNEDLGNYPRSPEADLAACEAHGADAVFIPSVEEMYPEPMLAEVTVEALSHTLCGRSRPTHFAGVCTVVAKLLNIVGPDRAYFGAKDFQQAAILTRMARDLSFPADMVVCPTVREPDGLAMSSRNRYLSESQRAQAPALHGSLRAAANRILAEQPVAAEVADGIRLYLAEHAPDGEIDYVEIVDPRTLRDVGGTGQPVLVALAVRFDGCRLIDNMRVDPAGVSL